MAGRLIGQIQEDGTVLVKICRRCNTHFMFGRVRELKEECPNCTDSEMWEWRNIAQEDAKYA